MVGKGVIRLNRFSMLGTIHIPDLWRGLIVAVVMAVLTTIYQTIQTGSLAINWTTVAVAGIGAGISYILKNFGTGVNGRMMTNSK